MKLGDLIPSDPVPSQQASPNTEAPAASGKLTDLVPAPVNSSQESGLEKLKAGLPVVQAFDKSIKDYTALTTHQSPVGQLLEPLNKPMNFAAGRVADLVPGAQQALNPQKEWFPDIAYSDVLNFMTPSFEDAKKYAERNGMSPDAAWYVGAAYLGGRTTLGLAANFFGDPLMFAQFGKLTRLSEEAYKAGSTAKLERNLVDVRIPFTQKSVISVPAKPLTDAVSKAAKATGETVSKVPGASAAIRAGEKAAEIAKDMISALDYKTGVTEIDHAASQHAGLKRGDTQYIYERFYKPLADKKFTTSENQVLVRAIESTPNASGDPDKLIQPVQDAVQKHSSELGVSLSGDRSDDLVRSAISIKLENARDLQERVEAGLISSEDMGKKVIENYLVHKMSPAAEKLAARESKKAAALEEVLLKRSVLKTTQGNHLSSFDTGKYARTLRVPLEEANQLMKEKTGISDFFITDPIVATAMKRAETRKLIRDKELLDVVEKYGVRPENMKEATLLKKAGYSTIDHPNFQSKTVVIRDGEKTLQVKFRDLYFPKQIAGKMGYYMIPREIGNFNAFLDSYNNVFRTTALMKADYYVENWMDNILKNFVQDVKIEDYVDTLKIFTAEPTSRAGKILSPAAKLPLPNKETIRIRGKEVSAKEVHELLKTWGIMTGGQFREGIEKALFTGKKIFAEQSLMGKAGMVATYGPKKAADILHGIRQAGESGENITRAALFINRLKQGYTPKMAALEVEKYLFDFSRRSQAVDVARRYYQPFIQAAIKTAQIAPALIGKAPGVWNFYENNLMKTLESAFQDPVNAWAIKQLYPDYLKIQDPIAGPLLPANHWLAILAGSKPTDQMGATVALKLPGGLNILNQFMMWDKSVRTNATSAPILKSLIMATTGIDPFTGKDVDIAGNGPLAAGKLNAALQSFIDGAIAFPNLKKSIYQGLGLGNPEYFTAASLNAFHGSLGKFGRVTNLDKEYLFKLISLAKAERALREQFASAVRAEANGKTADILYSDKPLAKGILNVTTNTLSSAEIYAKLMDTVAEHKETTIAGGVIRGEVKPSDIPALIKNIRMTAKQLNEAYVVSREQYHRMAKEQQEEALKAARERMNRTPQGLMVNINGRETYVENPGEDDESAIAMDYADYRKIIPKIFMAKLGRMPRPSEIADQTLFARDWLSTEGDESFLKTHPPEVQKVILDLFADRDGGWIDVAEPVPGSPWAKTVEKAMTPEPKFHSAGDDKGALRFEAEWVRTPGGIKLIKKNQRREP